MTVPVISRAPWELGKAYHGVKFWVVDTMIDREGRPCVYLEIKARDGRRLRRWTSESIRW